MYSYTCVYGSNELKEDVCELSITYQDVIALTNLIETKPGALVQFDLVDQDGVRAGVCTTLAEARSDMIDLKQTKVLHSRRRCSSTRAINVWLMSESFCVLSG